MQIKKQIGTLLVESGIITPEQLEEALRIQKENNQQVQVGEILKSLGYVTEQQVLMALEYQLGIPCIELNRVAIPQEIANKIPPGMARRHGIVPVKIQDHVLYIAMEDPFDIVALNDARLVSGMEIYPMLARKESIHRKISDLYGNESAERAIEEWRSESVTDALSEVQDSEDEIGNAPIVRLINSILEQAIRDGASDIHIEPQEMEVRIRLRIDGTLYNTISAPRNAHAAMITRIKIMGSMNIAEKRLPQDGRCDIELLGHNIDLRISTLPTVHGEKAVLRVLDRESFLIPKEKLGFTRKNLEKFDTLLKNPHGIILVTGPTGSGKSTTLYTMLNELNNISDNIITIEDPVEYLLEGINQVQVNAKAGLDFAAGLRSILRQDPDIIMVGEIRDQETVNMAIRAAITGHLVLSTIHTNDSISTISRLLNMGIPSYMLAASLVGVISQRLVRTICPFCKAVYTPSEAELSIARLPAGSEDIVFYKGTGCDNCAQTGYKGRIAVHEVLSIGRGQRDLIQQNASLDQIRDYSVKHGFTSLKRECINLVRQGLIPLDELIRVAYTQDE